MPAEVQHEKHEAPDVRTRRVVALALGFVAFATFLGGGLAIYYRHITFGQRLAMTPVDFPAPRLQPNPVEDWNTFHKAQVEALQGYNWVDQPKGLIHVPIDRAMQLVVARGQKAYDPVEGTPPFPQPGSAPLDGAPRAMPQAFAAPYGEVH